MKTRQISPEEMESRIARFDSLTSYQSAQNKSGGIPAKALEYLAAGTVYPVMAPEGMPGRHASAPVKSWPGMTIGFAVCPPGDGPVPHAHSDSLETFFCVKGEFEITWGDNDEHSINLKQNDLISVPPMVMRKFQNLTDEDAHLLVIHQGNAEMKDAVLMAPEIGAEIEQNYGADVVEAMAQINLRFDADLDSESEK